MAARLGDTHQAEEAATARGPPLEGAAKHARWRRARSEAREKESALRQLGDRLAICHAKTLADPGAGDCRRDRAPLLPTTSGSASFHDAIERLNGGRRGIPCADKKLSTRPVSMMVGRDGGTREAGEGGRRGREVASLLGAARSLSSRATRPVTPTSFRRDSRFRDRGDAEHARDLSLRRPP